MLAVLLAVLAASSCSPSASGIQAAIAETQASYTATPTLTATATATSTLLPTPTPDRRVITMTSENFLLDRDDLPSAGRYYLPYPQWTGPHLNIEIIHDWGTEDGEKYIEDTGRVEGWFVEFVRGTVTYDGPQHVYNNVIRFETADGPRVYFGEYGHQLIGDGFREQEGRQRLGEISKHLVRNDGSTVRYLIEFSHRNYVERIMGIGRPSEIKVDFLISLGTILLERLEEAPLEAPQ